MILLKIQRKINDLVNESLIDIDSLDEEIKMSVVKFKKEKQKKMKGISKAIYIISRIGKVLALVISALIVIGMVLMPFTINNIEIVGTDLVVSEYKIGFVENQQELSELKNLYDAHTNVELIIYTEVIALCILIACSLVYLILNELEKLFKNIHDGETPFTMDNVLSIKRIAKYLIIAIIVPIISGYIMQLIMNIDLGIEIELMDFVFILIIYSVAYIFEYGYEIQLDSKGKMYGDENE